MKAQQTDRAAQIEARHVRQEMMAAEEAEEQKSSRAKVRMHKTERMSLLRHSLLIVRLLLSLIELMRLMRMTNQVQEQMTAVVVQESQAGRKMWQRAGHRLWAESGERNSGP